jgi:hypothetical protein
VFRTSAYKIQTPGNYPEENIQHLQHGESLKSRTMKSSAETTPDVDETESSKARPSCFLN